MTQKQLAVGNPPRLKQIAPALTLVLLSPIISELLSGSTRVSYSYALLPEIGVWGCGTLLVRYFVRSRTKSGWTSIFILGIALAMAEELIIQQTSLAPTAGLNPADIYGRFIGVNWIYLIWALGYESIWVVVLPISLAEIIFPSRKEEKWIGRRGVVLASIYFVLGAVLAWYSWTHFEAPSLNNGAVYSPAPSYILIALVAIALCIYLALKLRSREQKRSITEFSSPSTLQWFLEAGSLFLLSLCWFVLVFLAEGKERNFPLPLALIIAVAVPLIAFSLVTRWLGRISLAEQDYHRLALIFGAMLGSMTGGIISMRIGGALMIDFVSDVIFNGIAIVLLTYLTHKVRTRSLADNIQAIRS